MEISGQTFWLILLTLGVLLLAGAMAYGRMRTKSRTAVERAATEAATRREYAEEDRDAG
jgi:hypothetical protein